MGFYTVNGFLHYGFYTALTTVSLIFPLTSSKVEYVGLVMISWLMSICHNKDIFVLVNVKLS